jgi:transposase
MIKSMFEESMSCNATATRYGVAASTAIKLKHHFLLHKTHLPLKVGGGKTHILSKFDKLFRDLICQTPDATLEEMSDFMADKGVILGTSSIARYLSHIGFSLKKRHSSPRNKKEKTLSTAANNGRNTRAE